MKQVLVLIILLLGCSFSAFSQTEKRIEEIRKIYHEVNRKVVECEVNGDTSTTFLTEIIVNKNDGPYPAVGIYKTTVKFYYTFGDREKNPYPNRLLKIIVTTNRSAMTENLEFLFNEKGQLIFYFEKKEEERRVYFETEKAIKILQNEKTLPVSNKQEARFVKTILSEKRKLVGIFQSSLVF
jgi:hypothetical protein